MRPRFGGVFLPTLATSAEKMTTITALMNSCAGLVLTNDISEASHEEVVIPPFITMLHENPRSPYPISWQEQDALFRKLLARMARCWKSDEVCS